MVPAVMASAVVPTVVPAVAVTMATAVSAVVSAVGSLAVPPVVSAVDDVAVFVMYATSAGSAPALAGGREHPDGARAVPGVDRRVGAAIGHGRRGGQGRPQQDRDRQQAPGTGSVHPGSMGPRAPAHVKVGSGSPERAEFGP